MRPVTLGEACMSDCCLRFVEFGRRSVREGEPGAVESAELPVGLGFAGLVLAEFGWVWLRKCEDECH